MNEPNSEMKLYNELRVKERRFLVKVKKGELRRTFGRCSKRWGLYYLMNGYIQREITWVHFDGEQRDLIDEWMKEFTMEWSGVKTDGEIMENINYAYMKLWNGMMEQR